MNANLSNEFKLLLWFWIISISFPVNLGAQETIWIETEKFARLGGWTIDWQFIDQMGSPYLLANGLGIPVEDASTLFNVKAPADYRIWVRTHDWDTTYHPGRFKIIVNEKSIKNIFGQSGKRGWLWEDGGIVQLGFTNIIKLKDLTGYYGRCDAIVLSKDKDWMPPNEMDSIATLRVKYDAISHDICDMGYYDVVVIGGGLAGSLAAVAAAREGARTVLVQNRKQLGGNASTEILVPPVGVRGILLNEEEKKYDVRETGLIEEVANYGQQDYFKSGKYYPSRLLRLVESEPNIDLFLETHVTGVEMNGDSDIVELIGIQLPEGQRVRFRGNIFIDCTGNGTIGLKAGAEYMHGRESKDMYGETKAPDIANNTTLPSSLKYWYESTDIPQKFEAPPWIYSFPTCEDFGTGKIGIARHPVISKIDHQWTIELGGTQNTFKNAEEIRDDLFRLIYGLWDHTKNHCPELKRKATNYKLVWVGHVIGLRESYRLRGDYVMSEKDVTEQRLFKDRIAYAGWGLDDHPSLGFFEKEKINMYSHGGVLHSIPYRSLYSKNIENLMMAGRNISVTHVVLSGTRVMLTNSVIAHATGLAAGMAIMNNTTPRGIFESYLEEIQQKLMKQGAYIIELPNQDPKDLALIANIIVSSEIKSGEEAVNGYSRARLSTAFKGAKFSYNAWIPDTMQKGPHWIELNWPFPREFNMIHITFQNRGKLAWRNFCVEGKINGTWQILRSVDNYDEFRRLVLPIGNIKTDKIRIVSHDPYVRGGICEIRIYNEPQHELDIASRVYKTIRKADPDVLLPWEEE
jgi:hypothetical protein